MTNSTAISIKGMTKSYGRFKALHGVDLEVKQGQIFGFLGPNGAGKTTTIRCLLDLIHRDGGYGRGAGFGPSLGPRRGASPGRLYAR